jgi:hypothetical protein
LERFPSSDGAEEVSLLSDKSKEVIPVKRPISVEIEDVNALLYKLSVCRLANLYSAEGIEEVSILLFSQSVLRFVRWPSTAGMLDEKRFFDSPRASRKINWPSVLGIVPPM